MTTRRRPTVAVIGGGFSGLMTALHLLDLPDGPRVRLIERRVGLGRGAAYSQRSAEHLLNVRALNMSAWPERPRHFVDWLARRGDEGEAAFASRARYGAYLQEMLSERTRTVEAGRFLIDADAAVGLEPEGGGWRLRLGVGRELQADAVVLAVGNLPPHAPAEMAPEAAASSAHVADPWSAALDAAPHSGCAVLLGTGLTMVDVALRLAHERPGLRLMAISRRGLLPRRHLTSGPAPQPWTPRGPATPLSLLREVRAHCDDAADWRCVVDGLRAQVQGLWRGWPPAERRRFLRHLRPWWDVHRHRIAPQVATGLDHLMAGGVLRIATGRLSRIDAAPDGLDVVWRPRDAAGPRTTRAALLVNCTGPNGDLKRADDPLLVDLSRGGLVRADGCRLGLDVDGRGRLLSAQGEPHATLFAVGPVTRGAFWEVTSVPDIRVQAAACAGQVQAALAAGAARPQISPARGLEGSA